MTSLSGIYAGLNSTYAYLASQYKDGLTLENIAEARTNTDNLMNLNQTFASYLQTNFSALDADGDGVISAAEANNTISQMSASGLTKAQLTQLQASGASGITSSDYSYILENFEAMDSNGDGRITDAEIAAYKLKAAKMEKEDEMNNKFATNMSTFYGDDSASSANSYSILSYKYKTNK